MSHKKANLDWDITNDKGNVGTWEQVGIAVMMDIRQELRALHQLLRCPNFQAIPHKLDAIRLNTRKSAPKRKVRAS